LSPNTGHRNLPYAGVGRQRRMVRPLPIHPHSYRSCSNRHCPKCQGRRARTLARGPQSRTAAHRVLPCGLHPPDEIANIASTTKKSSTASSSTPLPKPCSPPQPNVWVWNSASSACSIAGAKNLHFHRTCTASFPAAGLSPATSVGSPPPPIPAAGQSPLPPLPPPGTEGPGEGVRRWRPTVLRRPRTVARCERLRPIPGSSRTQRVVVYAKPPFGGPAHVLEYLGRYTHRVAISNRRLLALQDGQVSLPGPTTATRFTK